jgi:glycosyltransferase involved in cell wall biosynthesis
MILVNFLSVQGGGSLTYFINITPKLIDLDKNEDFLFLVSNTNFQYLLNNNKSILKFMNKFIVFDDKYSGKKRFFSHFKIKKQISKYRINKVFTPYQIAMLFPNVKNILMIRNMEPFLFEKYKYDLKNRIRNYMLSFFSKSSLKRADKVIAVSHYSKDYLFDVLKLEKEKVSTIYHGRDFSFSNIENKNKDLAILKSLKLDSLSYLFTAGSFLPYRRLEDILEAFSKVEKNSSLQLVVAGDGNDDTYKRKINNVIKKYNLESSVIFTGYLNKSHIQTLYRHALIFITATEIEACPNIAIESLSSGCAVISSDSIPLKEIYQDAAIYFKKRDTSLLAEQIERLLNDQNARDILSEKALKIADNFSWDICAKKTYELLNKYI